MPIRLILAALCAVLFSTAADARPRHTSPYQGEVGCSDPVMRPCGVGFGNGIFSEEITRKSLRHKRFYEDSGRKEITHRDTVRRMPPALATVMAEGAGRVVGGRPSGCPHAFCGCGASLYVFGRIIPSLNLAANWVRKFPRAAPAPGMVAARRGHVFVLVRHIEGSVWLAHDSNSGRHLTRVHARSIAGFVIVDPRTNS